MLSKRIIPVLVEHILKYVGWPMHVQKNDESPHSYEVVFLDEARIGQITTIVVRASHWNSVLIGMESCDNKPQRHVTWSTAGETTDPDATLCMSISRAARDVYFVHWRHSNAEWTMPSETLHGEGWRPYIATAGQCKFDIV